MDRTLSPWTVPMSQFLGLYPRLSHRAPLARRKHAIRWHGKRVNARPHGRSPFRVHQRPFADLPFPLPNAQGRCAPSPGCAVLRATPGLSPLPLPDIPVSHPKPGVAPSGMSQLLLSRHVSPHPSHATVPSRNTTGVLPQSPGLRGSPRYPGCVSENRNNRNAVVRKHRTCGLVRTGSDSIPAIKLLQECSGGFSLGGIEV